MKLTDKLFWIKAILISLVIILLSGMIFYRHDIQFEEIGKVKNTMFNDINNFHPYGFVLIHDKSDLEYYMSCLDSIPFNIIEDFDLANYSYLLTFSNSVEKLSYSLYDTFRYDVSPHYCRVCKSGNQLLIVDYPNFTYREKSMYNNASLIGNDSIYIYRISHLPFLRGLQGL